jgi:hypothetical protein
LICINAALRHGGHRAGERADSRRASDRVQRPAELQMDIEASDLVVGLMTTVLGLLGLVLASGATDNGIYVFGLSLAGFAAVFTLGLIRRHYDRREAMRRGGIPHV